MLVDLDNHSGQTVDFQSDKVIGYHCTRSFPEDIKTMGLKRFNLNDRICYMESKLLSHGLNPLLVSKYLHAVRNDMSGVQQRGRDQQVWFCLNRALFEKEFGCERFFKYFGGEAMYRVALHNRSFNEIKDSLQSMGQPLVVVAEIDLSIVPEFQKPRIIGRLEGHHFESCEIYIKEDVLPSSLLRIEPAENYELFAEWETKDNI